VNDILERRRAISVTLVIALAMASTVCARKTETVRREAGLNVLLITIDTLRADAVGAYGHGGASTPWIDRLAAAGVRFSRAHAQTVVTLPSHANILSGRYPFRHGVRENAGFRFPSAMDTLATLLKSRGYSTGAFVSAFPLDVRFGLGRGFDVYDDRYGKSADKGAFYVPERRGTETVAAALQWITGTEQPVAGRQGPAPWFAWVHLYEPHFPYDPPEPFASRFKDRPYLGEVSAADAALGPLLGPILAQPAQAGTLVVLTGDHGESLGEHGEMTHGLFAYEGTLHVPLVIFGQRLLNPRVIEEPVQHVDILPTILDALGIAPPGDIDGRSLLPLAETGEAPAAVSYFESLSASLNRGWAPLFGVSRGSLKYIDLPIPELYDVIHDPSETNNLANSRPAEVRELQNLLAPLRAADRGPTRSSENAETIGRLRSLGYVTATPGLKRHFTDADDPKNLIDVDRAIDEVVTRYQRGDLRGAIGLGEALVRQRPDMPLSLTHLAFLYNEAADHRKAADAIRRALDLNPKSEEIAALFGAYLTEAGLAREAVSRLAPYAGEPQPDVDVLVAYGVALASTDRAKDAFAVFERARALDAANALPLIDIGTVYLTSGDRDRAAAAFAEALKIDPSAARAHNALGVIAAQRGHNEEAILDWQRAVAHDPRDHQALFNLGEMLIRLGRAAEARPYWERYVREAPAGLEAPDIDRIRQWLAAHPTKH
jgi:arylsulfatase A-like enzyme/Tfp pilus assembly protein PilF